MISSKLILFFCFYLLLLDGLLGQKTILKQGKNKKLLKKAIKFGETYGGELGELGLQWKQLLIEIVQVYLKVGSGKAQLARFNDSATTEEVRLVKSDTYADKFAELVAMRSQDIGNDQTYVDELKILKNEIASTMIAKMKEIEEKFKRKNVRKKVNGLTDTDIKEILFAEFINSEGGVSLIGARASTADALLSSFRDGMESILDGTYYEKLGMIQYGNEGEDVPVEDGADAGGDDVAPGNTQGGGGDPLEGEGGAPGGGPPDDGKDDDEDDVDPEVDDVDPEVDDVDPEGDDVDPEGDDVDPEVDDVDPEGDDVDPEEDVVDPEGDDVDPDEDVVAPDEDSDEDDDEGINFFLEIPDTERISARRFDLLLFPEVSRDETRIYTNTPEFTLPEQLRAYRLLNPISNSFGVWVYNLSEQLLDLERERSSGYQSDPSFQESLDPNLTNAERLVLHNRRADYIGSLLATANQLYEEYQELRDQIAQEFNLGLQNMIYYGKRLGGKVSNIDQLLVPASRPPPIPEFNRSERKDNAWRYLLSANHLAAFEGYRVRSDFERYREVKKNLNNDLNAEKARIKRLENPPPG